MPLDANGRHARLFRNGRNQAVRIPRDLEFPCDEVIIHQDGNRLILEPVTKRSCLLELLSRWEPIEDEFPDVDDTLPSLDDVEL